MPHYFFDLYENGERLLDEAGISLACSEDVRAQAMSALPAIAKEEVPKDGDRQAYTVLVRDEAGKSIYSATLTFAGLWLSHHGESEPRSDRTFANP